MRLLYPLLVAAALASGCATEPTASPQPTATQITKAAPTSEDRGCQVALIAGADRSLCADAQDREGCLRKFAVTAEHTTQVLKQAGSCLPESKDVLDAEINKPAR